MRENQFVSFLTFTLTLSYSHTIALALLFLAFAPGCSTAPAGPKRGKLDGSVTLNGKSVAKGFIRFLAIDPNGTNAASEIIDGKYSVPDGQGPTKGKYRVEFSIPSEAKKRIPNDDIPGEWIEIHPESLPAKYTTNSAITIDYDPEQPRSHDFQLTTP